MARHKKNHNRLDAIENAPCMDSIERYKLRLKDAEEDLKDVLSLSDRGVFGYEDRDGIVGRVYMHVRDAKMQLKDRLKFEKGRKK